MKAYWIICLRDSEWGYGVTGRILWVKEGVVLVIVSRVEPMISFLENEEGKANRTAFSI